MGKYTHTAGRGSNEDVQVTACMFYVYVYKRFTEAEVGCHEEETRAAEANMRLSTWHSGCRTARLHRQGVQDRVWQVAVAMVEARQLQVQRASGNQRLHLRREVPGLGSLTMMRT